MIYYKNNTATKLDITKHFEKTNFIPKLETYINVNNYIEKILKFSERIEVWEDGVLIGLSAIYLNNKDNKEGFLTNFSIVNDYTKKGIGTDLIKKTLIYSKRNGFNSIKLEVFSTNEKAIFFYSKNGFFKLNKSHDKIIMIKKI